MHIMLNATAPFYSSSRNTRDFNREIRAQSETRLHREYNLAMKLIEAGVFPTELSSILARENWRGIRVSVS